MKYKAIIFDLDGTAIPNRRDGMPSEHLVEVVAKLKDKIHICAATGRPITMCAPILEKLKLTAPCVISAGTQIIDPVTKKILWQKPLSKDQVRAVMEVAKKYNYPVLFSDEVIGEVSKDKEIKESENYICIEPVTKEDTLTMLPELNKISDVVAHPVISWTAGHFDIHVTHREATKKHAIEILLEKLGVKKEEVIGFGDAENDLPLFEMCGYKVAMSNGAEKLKTAADLVVPNDGWNGLAHAIEKLVII